MLSSLRIWLTGWRQDYEGWWVRARRQGDSQDIIYSVGANGLLEESCIAIKEKHLLLQIDNLAADLEKEWSLFEEAEFASKRVGRAGDLQDRLSPKFRGSFWRHQKRNTEYVSMGVGLYQTSDPKFAELDQQTVMIYVGLDGNIWVRGLKEFLDGRFVCINGDPIVKYGLVGAAGYHENGSATDGGSSALSESPTQEPGASVPEGPY